MLFRSVPLPAIAPLTALALGVSACGSGDRAPLLPIQVTPYQAEVCEVAPAPEVFFEWAPLSEATYYNCSPPREGDGSVSMLSAEGRQSAVTGAPTEMTFEWPSDVDPEDRLLVIWQNRGTGFFTLPLESVTSPLVMDMRVSLTATTGDYDVAMAISEGLETDAQGRPIIGEAANTPIYVVSVGTGDVQVNLHWDTLMDLDLYVRDPAGDLLYWSDRDIPSGGILDVDSYPACRVANDLGRGNENTFWWPDTAPTGQYEVFVDAFNDCGTFGLEVTTHYEVNITTSRGLVQRTEGTFFAGKQFDPNRRCTGATSTDNCEDVGVFDF